MYMSVYLSECTPLKPVDWLVTVKLSTQHKVLHVQGIKMYKVALKTMLTLSYHGQSRTSLLQHKTVQITDPTICRD